MSLFAVQRPRHFSAMLLAVKPVSQQHIQRLTIDPESLKLRRKNNKLVDANTNLKSVVRRQQEQLQ